jgi:hypothetical protein
MAKFIEALQAGKSLADPAHFKEWQLLIPPFALFCAYAAPWFGLDATQSKEVAFWLAGITVLTNHYLTVATTDKIGLLGKPKP